MTGQLGPGLTVSRQSHIITSELRSLALPLAQDTHHCAFADSAFLVGIAQLKKSPTQKNPHPKNSQKNHPRQRFNGEVKIFDPRIFAPWESPLGRGTTFRPFQKDWEIQRSGAHFRAFSRIFAISVRFCNFSP